MLATSKRIFVVVPALFETLGASDIPLAINCVSNLVDSAGVTVDHGCFGLSIRSSLSFALAHHLESGFLQSSRTRRRCRSMQPWQISLDM